MKILIAIPTFENILPEVFKAVYDLDKGSDKVDFQFVKGYDCAKARNVISKKAIEGGYDYVMMIDSDTIVPKNAILDMLDPAADVVMGCCPRKNTKDGMTALFSAKDNAKGKGFHHALSYKDLQDEKRIELKGGGFACVLINTKVFEKLEYPYFKYIVYEDGSALSEDLYFCKMAKKAGFRIYADTRVKCGHLARYFQYE